MIHLYRLSEHHFQAAAGVGVDDIERRQHVQQLTQKVLSGCRQASLPFDWLRAKGLDSIATALSSGLDDGQALVTVLEATYSQVLEVILSTLDRDLIPPTPPGPQLPPVLTPVTSSNPSSSSNASSSNASNNSSSDKVLSREQQSALLSAVGRYPAGHAPAAASSEELLGAYKVMQALCLLHPKSRSLLRSAQNLQLVTARACEAPCCLSYALDTLLTLMQGNEEAQAMFVTTGGLDMLLTRTLQHTHHQQQQQQMETAGSSDVTDRSRASSSAEGPPDLLMKLLVFLQMLLGWCVGEAVRKGAHPSTQRAAVTSMTRHLSPAAAKTLTQGLTQLVLAAGTEGPAGRVTAAAAASFVAATSGLDEAVVKDGYVSVEDLLQLRAKHAATTITSASGGR